MIGMGGQGARTARRGHPSVIRAALAEDDPDPGLGAAQRLQQHRRIPVQDHRLEPAAEAPLASQDGLAIMTRMPATKTPRTTSSKDLNAAIERVAPDVLTLLADGVPRNRATIVKALADRHAKQDVQRALARLAVLGQLEIQGSRYTLPADDAEQG
jgi:hypothetical protein